MVGTSTLVFRPAPSAFSALSAPSASSVAPNDLSPAFAALPPLEQAMPSRAMRRRIADLPLEDDRASHFFLAGAGVRDPDQNRIFVAAAGVKLDYEVQVVKSQMDETSEDVNSCRGYVDSLRHHQKVKNLWVTGLIALVKEHGTPELKAGVSFFFPLSTHLVHTSPSPFLACLTRIC
jgi:hypothetical protein